MACVIGETNCRQGELLHRQRSVEVRTDVHTYAKVKYEQVYPGVDLILLRATRRQLEYDLVLAPGADPNVIKPSYKGIKKLAVNKSHLVLHTAQVRSCNTSGHLSGTRQWTAGSSRPV